MYVSGKSLSVLLFSLSHLIHGSTIHIRLASSKMETSLVRKGFVWGQGDWWRREDIKGKRKRSNDQIIRKMWFFISLKGNT